MTTTTYADIKTDAPWLAREDWASGKIKQLDTRQLAMHWFIAVMVNIVFGGLSWYAYDRVFVNGNIVMAVAFVPSTISIAYLMWVLWLTIFVRKHDQATLILETIPGVIGGELNALIQTTASLNKAVELRLLLACMCPTRERRVSGGPHGSIEIVHKSIYEEEWLLPLNAMSIQGDTFTVPISTGIPFSSRETSIRDEDEKIYWILKFIAKFPRGQYSVAFEVPVFTTRDSDPQFQIAAKESKQEIAEKVYESVPTYARVTVTQMDHGGSRFLFGPVRMVFGATMWSVMTLVVSTISIVLVLRDVHLAWKISIGLLALFFVYTALHLWLFISVVYIRSGEIRLRKGILSIGLPRVIACQKVKKVTKKLHSGRSDDLFKLVLILDSDKQIVIDQFLSDENHTDWLVKKMQDVINSETY